MLRIAYFAIPLLLAGGMVAAADLPVPKQVKKERPLSQKKFERTLLGAPIGQGRLE